MLTVIEVWNRECVAIEVDHSLTGSLDLPPALRQLADSLRALHTNDYDYAVHFNVKEDELKSYREIFTSSIYEAEHRVVRIHPEKSECTLVLGQFVKKILGYSTSDSEHLITLLSSYVTRPENTVRWRWSPGDVVIWDNRATQHYAINDYGDQYRVVRRVTIAGDTGVAARGEK